MRNEELGMKVAASPRSFDSDLSFSFHHFINNLHFSALRMTKWGDARSLKLAVFSYRKPNP